MYICNPSQVGSVVNKGYFKPGSPIFAFLNRNWPQKFNNTSRYYYIEAALACFATYILRENLIYDPKSQFLKLNSELEFIFKNTFIELRSFVLRIYFDFILVGKENLDPNARPELPQTSAPNLGPDLPILEVYYQKCLSSGRRLRGWALLEYPVPEVLKKYFEAANLKSPTYSCIFMEEFFLKICEPLQDDSAFPDEDILILDGTPFAEFFDFLIIFKRDLPRLFRHSLARHLGVVNREV